MTGEETPGTHPQVTVVIPTYQRCKSVYHAVESLTTQTTDPEHYEVIVAVDGSTDGTREMLSGVETPYSLVVLPGPHRGRAATRNAALERARGEVVILLDDDMEVAPTFIERHAAHHPPGSRVCVLGGVPVTTGDDSPHAARYVADKFADLARIIGQPDHEFVPRDFYSGNTSLRAEVLQEVGGFDEVFDVYGNEDVELGVRLKKAGVELRFDPDALAHQRYEKNLVGLARDNLSKGRTTVLLARGHPEIFGFLRLANPRDASRAWLILRAGLLALTRRVKPTAAAVFSLGGMLERLGLWRQPLFYRALLDYAFWAGVDGELTPSVDPEPLALLAAELHRGPLDFLLHR